MLYGWSLVKILDVEYGDEMTYRIVSSLESAGEGETITDKSPVGRLCWAIRWAKW